MSSTLGGDQEPWLKLFPSFEEISQFNLLNTQEGDQSPYQASLSSPGDHTPVSSPFTQTSTASHGHQNPQVQQRVTDPYAFWDDWLDLVYTALVRVIDLAGQLNESP